MPALNEVLGPIEVTLDQLLIDPNNPRFSELGEPDAPVPEFRIPEDRVQQYAMGQMKAERFDVAELRDTIKTVGYLPIDRIVIRQWRGDSPETEPKYVVVEGNRRIAALKWLIELHETGRETFTSEQLQNFNRIPALLLDEHGAPAYARLVLPGLRHVSGIKEWGAYQKARTVHVLRSAGQTPREVAQSLGLSTQAANQHWRSYRALEQMRADEEYGELVMPNMYSYFEEIMKRPNVRSWLGWSDEEGRFAEPEHTRETYGWIAGELVESGDGEVRSEPKLPEAKSIRELSRFIEDEAALALFRSPDGNLTRALSRHEAETPQDWRPSVGHALRAISSLSPDTLREMQDQDLEIIRGLYDRIGLLFDDRKKLLSP